MEKYYSLLINTKPDKAFDLALKMFLESKVNYGYWERRMLLAKSFIYARQLIDTKKPLDALTILNKIDLSNSRSRDFIDEGERLSLFKAEAQDYAGQTQAAFDSLALYYSKNPSDLLRSKVLYFGNKINKDTASIMKEINSLRIQLSEPATLFSLDSYYTNEKVNLSDFRGKVTLLTYWYPGCGPCRAEFPYFESVIRKFNKNDVGYLGINVAKEQDGHVLPFMKSTNYSFIPLREGLESKGNLSTFGFPTNYLIDQSGRIVLSNFRINEHNERMLELMISELLENVEEKNP